MADLILSVKKFWFDEIKTGKKTIEYREVKPYWTKRLNKKFDRVIIVNGYPKIRDETNSIIFPWSGVSVGSLKKDMDFYNQTVDTLNLDSDDVCIYQIFLKR